MCVHWHVCFPLQQLVLVSWLDDVCVKTLDSFAPVVTCWIHLQAYTGTQVFLLQLWRVFIVRYMMMSLMADPAQSASNA